MAAADLFCKVGLARKDGGGVQANLHGLFFYVFFGLLAIYGVTYAIDSNWHHEAQQAYDRLTALKKPGDFRVANLPQYEPFYYAEHVSLAVWGVTFVLGFMEYGVLRLVGNFRLGALVRVTYYEALLQPFSLILLAVGLVGAVILSYVPYFTQNEDPKMYRDVATELIFAIGLIFMVFSASKVIDEEIENRTMLTLMSKPIARWQVIVGKYLGVVCLIATTIGILGIVTALWGYLYYISEARIDFQVAGSVEEARALLWEGQKTIIALLPYFVLMFLQLATLAAISVAISTRYGMAFNMTAIFIIYIVANLSRYVDTLNVAAGWKALAVYASYLLPNLNSLDLQPRLIYGQILIGSDEPFKGVPRLSEIWAYIGLAAVYGVMYIGAALSMAVALFRTRELT